MSEQPHIRAYLCDECWNSIPHYKVDHVVAQKPEKGPTHNGVELREIVLYTIGNLICMAIIAYYLWFKQENMSISKCERCDGRAIIYGIDGSWRCVICDPKEYTWNKKTMSYE